MPREVILQGSADVENLNGTINGEGDGEFLQNLIVIINRELRFCRVSGEDGSTDELLAVDFEFYSENGLGAIQGQGYIYRITGK